FPFDAGVLDWKYYLQDVHCPAVTVSLRELSRRDREKPVVRIRPRDDTVLAVFDMEGTIISSNVVESYVWTRFADLPLDEWPAEMVSVFGRIPGYLQIDRRDRGDFLRTFFRRYEGASVAGVEALIRSHVAEFMFQKASPAAIRRVCRLVQRPAVAARRRQPGRGVARLGALPAREAPALADRSVGDVTFDAEGSFPEAGGALMHGCVRQRESDVSDVTLPF